MMNARPIYAFGTYRFDPARGVLSNGGGYRRATAGNAGVRVHPIRLAVVVLLGAATTKEHRGYEEERCGMTHATIMARRKPFWYFGDPKITC